MTGTTIPPTSPRMSRGMKYAIAAGTALALAGTGYVAYDVVANNNRQTIFDGKIPKTEWAVKYVEGKDAEEKPFSTLTASRRGNVIVYNDNVDAKPLNWDANASWDPVKQIPRPFEGKLETVVFTDKKGTLRFARAEIDETTYSAKNKNEVFTSADAHYDAFRSAIILAKRGESDDQLARFLEAIVDK